jgi:hypothetical protein
MTKNYYGAHSYMGTNYTYDSPCWVLHVFQSAKERDEWCNSNEYNDQGNIVKESVSAKTACKIVGRKCIDDLCANVSHYEIENTYNRIYIH